jgi:hypothetical protein
MSALVSIILLNYWFFRHENVGCNFDSYFCNRMFLWWIAVPESTMRLFFFALKNSNYALNQRKMIALALPSIGYATWALICASFWEDMSPQCYEPYPSFGLMVMVAIYIFTLPAAIICIIVVAFFLMCCPCLTYMFGSWLTEQRYKQ